MLRVKDVRSVVPTKITKKQFEDFQLNNELSVQAIAVLLGISLTTVRRYIDPKDPRPIPPRLGPAMQLAEIQVNQTLISMGLRKGQD